MKTNKKLISRNDNARKWKHAQGGTLVSKYQTGTGKNGVVYTRLDVESLKKDPI